MAARGPEWQHWVDDLPTSVSSQLHEWDLTVHGQPQYGFCSIVLPVRTGDGEAAMLKIAFPDDESEHEHLALRRWDGQERCACCAPTPTAARCCWSDCMPATSTTSGISGVRDRRWDVPTHPRARVAAATPTRQVHRKMERRPGAAAAQRRYPHRMVEQAVSLGTDLVSDPASTGTLIHGDLHYENVLSADREPWLVIDPKPMSGDPHYEIAPMLWDRWDELAGYVREGVRRRFYTLSEAAGLTSIAHGRG